MAIMEWRPVVGHAYVTATGLSGSSRQVQRSCVRADRDGGPGAGRSGWLTPAPQVLDLTLRLVRWHVSSWRWVFDAKSKKVTGTSARSLGGEVGRVDRRDRIGGEAAVAFGRFTGRDRSMKASTSWKSREHGARRVR